MGIVYMLAAPDGKAYVGQTKGSLERRWTKHVSSANSDLKRGCRLINESIRLHGGDAFAKEVLVICNDAELEMYERKSIEMYRTCDPHGLNISTGGATPPVRPGRDPSLPRYVVGTKEDGIVIGYRVCNHPKQGGGEKRFEDRSLPLEEKKKAAIDYVNHLDGLQEPLHKWTPATDRKYVQKYKNGFCAKIPNFDVKYFVSTSATIDENFKRACNYADAVENGTLPGETYIRKKGNGYVVAYPNKKRRFFMAGSTSTLEAKYKEAEAYVEAFRRGESPDKKIRVEFVVKRGNGYIVRYPGFPTKTFMIGDTSEENYKLAVEHLDMLKSTEAVQRPNVNGAADFGKRVTATISRNGDLISNMYLQVTLPALQQNVGGSNGSTFVHYVNSIGHALLKSVEIEIGGQKIDKHYGEWLEIWSELTRSSEKLAGYGEMTGKYAEPDNPSSVVGSKLAGNGGQRTYYIPLIFWFNRVVGQSLPLIALQYHECKINIEFRTFQELIRSDKAISPVTTSGSPPSFVACSLYVDYIYCDTEERRKFAGQSHEYLIEQLQFTGDESVPANNSNSNTLQKIRMSFNHPVKELIWVIHPEASDAVNTLNGNMLFDYGEKDNLDYLASAKILLNGHDRFQERAGTYFRLVQPWQHHTRIPGRRIYLYSFALKCEEHQPSGTTNFSRIDNATLNLSIIPAGALKVKVFAVNYNILRLMSGMAGLEKRRAEKLHAATIWALVVGNSFVFPMAQLLRYYLQLVRTSLAKHLVVRGHPKACRTKSITERNAWPGETWVR